VGSFSTGADGRVAGSGIAGHVEPGFEAVRRQFEANFASGNEIGAACAVYWRGRPVVDLWGGWRDYAAGLPWEQDTLVLVFSATKGVAAAAMAVAESKGWFAIDERVSEYWPEFAQAGKGRITVRQLLSHQAGLSAIDIPLRPSVLGDLDRVAAACASQAPLWQPGTRHGYHGLTLGFFESELLRRVDPQHRSLGRFFADEIALPLGLEFYIGLPGSVSVSRVAAIESFKAHEMLLHLGQLPSRMVLAYMWPRSITARSLRNPPAKSPGDFNRADYRSVEFPAGGGIGRVADIARLYGGLACGGGDIGISQPVFDAIAAPPARPTQGDRDLVLKVRTAYSHGFMRPSRDYKFSPSPRAFGAPGAGGAVGFADPDAELGFAYAPNMMGVVAYDDPRERALRQACYECVKRLGP
jgi:CubicO group peptidase (beta-lactamase class C family)